MPDYLNKRTLSHVIFFFPSCLAGLSEYYRALTITHKEFPRLK